MRGRMSGVDDEDDEDVGDEEEDNRVAEEVPEVPEARGAAIGQKTQRGGRRRGGSRPLFVS